MSVVYDVIFESGKKLMMSGGCFGALNSGYFDHWALRHGNDRQKNPTFQDVNDGIEKHSMLRFYPSVHGKWEGKEKFWEEAALLMDELPWLKAYVVLRPSLETVDILTGENHADQVIIAAMIMRNLSQNENTINVYLRARQQGLTPAQAFIMSASFGISVDFRGTVTIYREYIGEYNMVNPHTFGRNSLRAMILDREEYNPWFLDSWQQLNGYRREEWFSDNDHEITRISGTTSCDRCLMDGLSLSSDDPLFSIDTIMDHRWGGINYQGNLTEQVFNNMCQELVQNWPQ